MTSPTGNHPKLFLKHWIHTGFDGCATEFSVISFLSFFDSRANSGYCYFKSTVRLCQYGPKLSDGFGGRAAAGLMFK